MARVARCLAGLIKHDLTNVLVSSPDHPLLHTRLQGLFNLRFDVPLDRVIYQLIVIHAIAAERTSPGGFDSCMSSVIRHLGGSPQPERKERSRGVLAVQTEVPREADLGHVINQHGSPETKELVSRALDLAGMTGKIIVEKSTSGVRSVELVRGHTFVLDPVWSTTMSFVKPRVVCIDGYVENVAELHHLLQAASETRETCVLFVRGLADDVKQTLRVNFDRRTLRIFPIVVGFDLEGINTMNDLAIVAGTDVVSSLKGELISSIDLALAPRVDRIDVSGRRIVVTNGSNRAGVRAHVDNLRKKRDAAIVADVASLIDVRIRSLLPNHVIIRLVDDGGFVQAAQAVDNVLRAVKSLVQHGLVNVDGSQMLAATHVAARVHSQRCCSELEALGAVIRS